MECQLCRCYLSWDHRSRPHVGREIRQNHISSNTFIHGAQWEGKRRTPGSSPSHILFFKPWSNYRAFPCRSNWSAYQPPWPRSAGNRYSVCREAVRPPGNSIAVNGIWLRAAPPAAERIARPSAEAPALPGSCLSAYTARRGLEGGTGRPVRPS